MNTLLLLFFALPIAVIIISIALQKILKCPFLVAAIIFAIFLVVTFILGNLIFLVATIIYAIIAFITAVLVKLICRLIKELDRRNCNDRDNCFCSDNILGNRTRLLSTRGNCNCGDNDNENLLTISSSGCNGVENELLTINSKCSRSDNNNNNCNDNDNNSCSCNCNTSNDSISVRANVFPNNNSDGRSGSFCGCFRRR